MNVASIIRSHARRIPDRPALVDGADQVDYAELDRRIDVAAARLRAAGLQSGDVAVITLAEGILHVVLSLAVIRLGAAVCALDWRSKPAERQAIVAALSPRLLLTDRVLPDIPGVSLCLVDPAWMLTMPAGTTIAETGEPYLADDGAKAAILLLSSGTTGLPKATVISHRAAAWRGAIRMMNFGFGPGTRVLSAMPLSTSAAVSGLLGQLVAGSTIIFHPTIYGPAEIVEVLQGERIQHVALVPTVLRWLLDLPATAGPMLPDITSLLVLGAAFHAEEKHAVLARITPNLFENYGSAGTGTMATATPRDIAVAPGSVGRPPMFTTVEVVDEDSRPIAVGAVGRIRVRTPGAASGYFGESGSTERNEVYRDGWVFPGDLGRLDGDGRLFLEGRAANLILRGGQNIYPEEIERVLLQHPAVADVAIVGRPDTALGEIPVALVVRRGQVTEAQLSAHCRGHLHFGKVPASFTFVDALPRTAAGKIRRAELASLLGGSVT